MATFIPTCFPMRWPARAVDLGVRAYGDVWTMQQELVTARQRDEIPDTLLFVEHPDVITLGRSARHENLIEPAGIPIFEVERGGDVTYHGPGQIVGYPIFQLREHERDLHAYLRNLEEGIIRALADVGVTGQRRPGWTGVWMPARGAAGKAPVPSELRKVASIGVAVKRWVTMHGFALNVSTDLARFAAINPCGLDATVMTSVSEQLGRAVTPADVRPPLLRRLAEVFSRQFDA
jgi:lipoyl(octanoyl) transferase